MIVHKKSNHHGSWAYHVAESWPVGPSPNHYFCSRCVMPDTAAEVDADTVKLVPHAIPIPSFSGREAIQQAIADIIAIF
eukprot:8076114-Ditylum_brightwellii.AAC.1